MNKKIIIPILMLMVIPAYALAYGWGEATLAGNAEIICSEFSDCINLKCMDEVREGAKFPSFEIRDYGNMDYYKECTTVAEPWCFQKDETCKDCTSGDVTVNAPIDAMNLHLNLAKGKSGCEKYKEVGKAFNYFLQSKNYWHQVKGEKSICVENFEKDTESFFAAGQFNDFTVESCFKIVHANDFKEWNQEFILLVESELGVQRQTFETQETTSTQTQTAEEQITQQKCLLEGIKYLNKFCTASRKIEGSISKSNYDPFSIVLLLFVIYFLYVVFVRRR